MHVTFLKIFWKGSFFEVDSDLKKINKERGNRFMNADKHSLMTEMYNDTFRDIKEGEIVKGTVVAVNTKEVVIDIGFKSEGFVGIEEFRNVEGLEVGREIEILIESIEDDEGRLILSHQKAEKLQGWMKLGDSINEGDSVGKNRQASQGRLHC